MYTHKNEGFKKFMEKWNLKGTCELIYLCESFSSNHKELLKKSMLWSYALKN